MAKRANRLPPPLSQASLGYASVTLKRRVHKFNIQASARRPGSRSQLKLELYPALIPNNRACRFRQALLFESEFVSRRLLLRLHDQEGAASVWTTNAQHNLFFVGLLDRRVEFIDVGDRLFGH